jgi:hypothetical protein
MPPASLLAAAFILLMAGGKSVRPHPKPVGGGTS